MTKSPTASRPIEVEQRDAARWLWLNRPERRNALNPALIAELETAIDDAEHDPHTSVLVIAGRGKSFCAGADLSVLLDHAEGKTSPVPFMTAVSRTFNRLESSPLPVVAAIHGHAVAGGLELALAADVVIATQSTLIGDGHVRNQLIPGGGSSVRLVRKLGPSMARWLLLTGDLLPARALEHTGWLRAVVADEQLYATVGSDTRRLAAHAGCAQAQIKPLLADNEGEATHVGLQNELDAFARHWETTPIADALRTFLSPGRAPSLSAPMATTRPQIR